MDAYPTLSIPANRDYPIFQNIQPPTSDVREQSKPTSGKKEYLIPWLATGIYVLALLAGAITIKTKIDDLRVEIGNMAGKHETALYYIVDNLPSKEFSPEEKLEIRKNLEGILKQK